jgi:hypothetical protein
MSEEETVVTDGRIRLVKYPEEKVPKNGYYIKYEWMHGDADGESFSTGYYKNKEEFLKAYDLYNSYSKLSCKHHNEFCDIRRGTESTIKEIEDFFKPLPEGDYDGVMGKLCKALNIDMEFDMFSDGDCVAQLYTIKEMYCIYDGTKLKVVVDE